MNLIDEISRAVEAHEQWKLRLKEAIASGSSTFLPEIVVIDNQCEFGKWLHQVPVEYRSSVHYTTVRDLHAQFHRTAALVLTKAIAGHPDEADDILNGNYRIVSDALVLSLLEWQRAWRAGQGKT